MQKIKTKFKTIVVAMIFMTGCEAPEIKTLRAALFVDIVEQSSTMTTIKFRDNLGKVDWKKSLIKCDGSVISPVLSPNGGVSLTLLKGELNSKLSFDYYAVGSNGKEYYYFLVYNPQKMAFVEE